MANDKKPELPPFAEFVNSNADLFGAIIVILIRHRGRLDHHQRTVLEEETVWHREKNRPA